MDNFTIFPTKLLKALLKIWGASNFIALKYIIEVLNKNLGTQRTFRTNVKYGEFIV